MQVVSQGIHIYIPVKGIYLYIVDSIFLKTRLTLNRTTIFKLYPHSIQIVQINPKVVRRVAP